MYSIWNQIISVVLRTSFGLKKCSWYCFGGLESTGFYAIQFFCCLDRKKKKKQLSVSWCICGIWVIDVHFHVISYFGFIMSKLCKVESAVWFQYFKMFGVHSFTAYMFSFWNLNFHFPNVSVLNTLKWSLIKC